jgi:hypothetical protein
MTSMEIVVDTESLRAGSLGPATGSIWVQLGDKAFPARGWNDFVVVILGAFARAVHRMTSENSQREVIHFMEGPYQLILERTGEGSVAISALHLGRASERQQTSEGELVDALLISGNGILEACRSRRCWTTDAQHLSDWLERVKASQQRFPNDPRSAARAQDDNESGEEK